MRTVRFTVGLCALALLCACGAEVGPLRQAQQLYEQGKVEQALLEVGLALGNDALNAEALLLRGRILLDQGDGARAQQEFRKALVLGIGHGRLDAWLARSMLQDRQPEQLLAELVPSAAHQGDVLADLHVARGMAHLVLADVASARSSFAMALVAVPDATDALLGLARLDYRDGQLTMAAARVERVLAKSPRLPEAWLFKGELLQGVGHLDEAVQAYEQAAQLAPNSVLSRIAAARILIGMGRLEPAQGLLDTVLRLAPDHPAANYTQALLHFRQHQYKPAQAFAEQALRLAPMHAPAAFVLAGAELAQGAVQRAEQRFLNIMQAFPNDVFARKLYVATVLQMNKPAIALEALEPVQGQMGADVELLSLAGQAHIQARHFAKAQSLLEQAAALQTDLTGAQVRLGLNQLSNGEASRGLAELERAAGMDKGGIRADFVLALAHLRRHEFPQALQAANKLQKKQPLNPIALNLAGAAQVGMAEPLAAKASFERALALDASYLPAAVNLARLDMDAGQRGAARQRLQAVLDREPGNVDAIVALARLGGARGELVRLLQLARAADPQAVAVRLMLARELQSEADLEGALLVAKEANAIAPESAETLAALGATQLAGRRRNDAVASYEKLVSVTAGAADARFRLAGALVAGEKFKAAETEYRRAIGLKPDHVQAMIDLAGLVAAQGQVKAAMTIAEELKARLPSVGAGDELMGDLLARQKRFGEAASAYDAAFAIGPSGALAVKQHGAAKQAAGSGQAVSLHRVQQWLVSNADDAVSRQYLADQQWAAGAVQAAIGNYQRVIEADPRNAFALNNLANAYHSQSDPRALAAAEAAHQLAPGHPQIADTLGWLLVQRGALERGTGLLTQAATKLAKSPDIAVHLAIALAKSGDRQGARALVKRRLDLGQDVKLDPATLALLQGS